MRVTLLVHSLVSCWNHGNAHFLRGIVRELQALGHRVRVLEPMDGWSRRNLLQEQGADALAEFARTFPGLSSVAYDPARLDLDEHLGEADLVLVHEWNEPALIARIGRHRAAGGRYRLLFHDTHHRAASRSADIGGLDLDGYDGVLAFGAALREIYLARGWARRVWVWHEAADTALFRPLPRRHPPAGDLVWIGNWGDEERSAELRAYLVGPVRDLGLRATVHGVRYPQRAMDELRAAGAAYGGWAANHRVPGLFSRHEVTVHVPRRPYAEALPGIPTIRVFEALACGIPLVSAPWSDSEGLFRPGRDFLLARDPEQMRCHLRAVLGDPDLRRSLAASGLARIRARHTCAHRVGQLLAIAESLGLATAAPPRRMGTS
jgi:spore maturation protein CgeB